MPLLHQHPIGLFGLRLGYGLPLGPHSVVAGMSISINSNIKKKIFKRNDFFYNESYYHNH